MCFVWSQFWFCFWWERGNDQISIFANHPFISEIEQSTEHLERDDLYQLNTRSLNGDDDHLHYPLQLSVGRNVWLEYQGYLSMEDSCRREETGFCCQSICWGLGDGWDWSQEVVGAAETPSWRIPSGWFYPSFELWHQVQSQASLSDRNSPNGTNTEKESKCQNSGHKTNAFQIYRKIWRFFVILGELV